MDKTIVIYFGIGRGGKIAKDYYQNKFDKNCRIIHCFIDQEFVSNQRSGESFNVKKVRQLLSNETLRIGEDEVDYFLNSIPVNSLNDPYHDNLKSVSNLFKQLYILHAVCSYINETYDKYVFIRDDTITELNEEHLEKIKFWSNSRPRILVSAHHWHGGICDRFFVVNQNGFRRFSLRLSHAVQSLHSRTRSSERIFRDFLTFHRYRVYADLITVRRVRNADKILTDRYLLPVHRPFELLAVTFSILKLRLGL